MPRSRIRPTKEGNGALARSPPAMPPSSELTLLLNAFMTTIKPSTDFRYNLRWSYGLFLTDIPQRLGSNEALDCSVDAVTTAHASFCTHRIASVEALAKYSRALQVLRVCLDDPVKAHSSNTLCAVMMLLICQAFLGPRDGYWSGHAEGAARILRARKSFSPRDDFERKLLHSLRACVLVEGLFNDKIVLSPNEWERLVGNDFDYNYPESQMMRLLAWAPDLMQRARYALHTGNDLTALRNETWSIYEKCKRNLSTQQALLSAIEASDTTKSSPSETFMTQILNAHYQRTYGFGLAVAALFNCMLSTLDPENSVIVLDSTFIAQEILSLAPRATVYRPIGASYFTLCLSAAWAVTTDPLLRSLIEVSLVDYLMDFKLQNEADLQDALEWTARCMWLGVPAGVDACVAEVSPVTM